MSIINISHIAIAVRDMELALPFWSDAVGLRIVLDTVEDVPGPGAPVRRRAVYLRQLDGENDPFVVLDQQLEGEAVGEPKGMFEIGVHHFGFWVDNIEPIAKRMQTCNVPILLGPVDCPCDRYGEPDGGQVRTLLVSDPDGNIVQFDQRVRDHEHAGNHG